MFDVRSDNLAPKGANMLGAVTESGGLSCHEVRVDRSVAISVHCELERLHAVVLRQKGREGTERIRWWGDVGEDVPEGGR